MGLTIVEGKKLLALTTAHRISWATFAVPGIQVNHYARVHIGETKSWDMNLWFILQSKKIIKIILGKCVPRLVKQEEITIFFQEKMVKLKFTFRNGPAIFISKITFQSFKASFTIDTFMWLI